MVGQSRNVESFFCVRYLGLMVSDIISWAITYPKSQVDDLGRCRPSFTIISVHTVFKHAIIARHDRQVGEYNLESQL